LLEATGQAGVHLLQLIDPLREFALAVARAAAELLVEGHLLVELFLLLGGVRKGVFLELDGLLELELGLAEIARHVAQLVLQLVDPLGHLAFRALGPVLQLFDRGVLLFELAFGVVGARENGLPILDRLVQVVAQFVGAPLVLIALAVAREAQCLELLFEGPDAFAGQLALFKEGALRFEVAAQQLLELAHALVEETFLGAVRLA